MGLEERCRVCRGCIRFRRLVNVVSQVGHGTLRIAIAGTRLGALADADVDAMDHLLDESLAAAACGFSTGLMYSPGESAPFPELERLCRVVERRSKFYTTHMRDYSFRLVDAVEEQLELARRTGCRLQISNFQAVGEANWGRQAEALERIERPAQAASMSHSIATRTSPAARC